MLPLHQLRVKLHNAIELGDAEGIDDVTDEIFNALGGCEKCYGRGYLVSNEIGNYCDCERAIRLEEYIKNYA